MLTTADCMSFMHDLAAELPADSRVIVLIDPDEMHAMFAPMHLGWPEALEQAPILEVAGDRPIVAIGLIAGGNVTNMTTGIKRHARILTCYPAESESTTTVIFDDNGERVDAGPTQGGVTHDILLDWHRRLAAR